MTTQFSDTDFRIIMTCVVFAVLALVRFRRLRRHTAWACGFAGIVGFAAWFNFGLQYHQWSDGFVNRAELYHYQLGSKYFAELGYDGLYAASLMAQRESAPKMPQGDIRNLVDNRIIPLEAHEPFLREVRARFDDTRWHAFVADHHNYIISTPPRFFRVIRLDHGYNPTPAWTFVARLFDAHIGSTPAALGFLGSLDIGLMGLMFVVLFRTYGLRTGCLALAITGLGFGWRFFYIGSLLRLDWIVAVVIGICMLKRERFVIAGACFGYATAMRVFPVLFLAGPGLLAVKAWLAGERPSWPLKLSAGFAVLTCAALIGGSMTGRGPSAWGEFAADLHVHLDTWSTNQAGLDTLFLSGPRFLIENLTAPTGRRTQQQVADTLEAVRAVRWLVAAAIIALMALATWRATLAESAVLGIVAIFVLASPASYYWIMITVVIMRREEWPPFAILALAIAMYVTAQSYSAAADQPLLYGLFAWGIAAILLGLIVPDAIRQLHRMNAPWRDRIDAT